MMKVGLFGGSFNPPHQGHLHISQLAIQKLGLNQIWWIPTAHNPFKEKGIYESYEIRCKKCEKISGKHPKIRIKKFDEIRTEKLVKMLQKKYRNHQFFWIAGADNLERLHEWDNFRRLIKMLPLVIFSRENFLPKISKTKAFQIYKKLRGYPLRSTRWSSGVETSRDSCQKKRKPNSRGLDSARPTGDLPKFKIFPTKNLNISSTEIRKNAKLHS